MKPTRWVKVTGDGLAYSGPCLLMGLIFWPDANADYVDIYDGRDDTSGKKFCRIESSVQVTWPFCFATGVPFDVGIFIKAIDAAVETTVVFDPLDE